MKQYIMFLDGPIVALYGPTPDSNLQFLREVLYTETSKIKQEYKVLTASKGQEYMRYIAEVRAKHKSKA